MDLKVGIKSTRTSLKVNTRHASPPVVPVEASSALRILYLLFDPRAIL
jgi:hypothetical protein